MKLISILFILLPLVSCINSAGDTKEEFEIIYLTKSKLITTKYSLDDIAKEVSYVVLNTERCGPIGNIKHIEKAHSFIFVQDENSLFRFDTLGNFINRIGRKGRGPGEYLQISSFSLDETKEVIYILDTNNIIKYTFDGVYINISPRILGINNILFTKNILYCSQAILNPKYVADSGRFELTLLSEEFKILVSLLPVSRSKDISIMFAYKANIYNYNGDFFYNDPFKDTVYIYQDLRLNPAYLFVSDNNHPKMEISKIFETNDFILLKINNSNIRDIIIFNKTARTSHLLEKTDGIVGFLDNVHYLSPFSPRFINGQMLMDVIYPVQLTKTDTLFNRPLKENDLILRIVKV